MSFQDNYPRPYYVDYERVPTEQDFGWYEVFALPGDVLAITEPRHCEEVNSYLILGSKRALLWDTGGGFYDIRPLVSELYPGEVIVANSHSHFDHIGSNHRFDLVHAYDTPLAHETAKKGAPTHVFGNLLGPENFVGTIPGGLVPETFSVPPYRMEPVSEGHVFDLGDRRLEVIHTPGHSPDSMMLLDLKHGILFTGDMLYDAAMYAHFDCPEFGGSDVEDYKASLRKLLGREEEIQALYCSHNNMIVPKERIGHVLDALEAIENGTVKERLGVEPEQTYLEDGSIITKCVFDDFSIIVKI